MGHKIRLCLVLVAVFASPFAVAKLAGLRWGCVAAGVMILFVIVGISHLAGRVEGYIKHGAQGDD